MKMIFALLFLLVTSSKVHIEEPITELPWKVVSTPLPTESIKLVFALKQQNLARLDKIFHEVSDPQNENYGKHLSRDEINHLVSPSLKTKAAIVSWLAQYGVHPNFPSPDFAVAVVPIAKAEAILSCKYQTYEHDVTGFQQTRTLEYRVPALIAKHLDFVAPTVQFSSMKSSMSRKLQFGAPAISTDTLRTLYSVGDIVGHAANNKQAVTGFLKQYYKESDQNEFYREFYKKGEGMKITVKGTAKRQGFRAGIESMLDTEYVTVTGTNITTEFWSYDGNAPDNKNNEPFLDWLLDVGNTSDAVIPKLFSTSYGEDESSVSTDYADRINVEFQKVATRGISILFASGDSGATSATGGCDHGKFVPQWPAGSPYVTSVGATTGGLDSGREAASFSSGGFSNRYDQPKWQSDAVAAYLQNSKVPSTSMFNSAGRGFPDISAAGTGFTVVANRIPMPGVSGTSCASPTAAGVFSLLNDIRLQQGKSSLGFLNPLIYQNMASFNDITAGSNEGCEGTSDGKGFPAVQGWDAVTGVGTPNYVKLAQSIVAMEN